MIPIIFSTITGNGYKLAHAVKEALADKAVGPYNISYVYDSNQIVKYSDFIDQSDVVILTYWCDYASCDQATINILKRFKNKKVIMLGTMGAPESETYLSRVKGNIKTIVEQQNTLVGNFLCRGAVDLARSNIKRQIPEGERGHLSAERYTRHLESQEYPRLIDLQQAAQYVLKCLEENK